MPRVTKGWAPALGALVGTAACFGAAFAGGALTRDDNKNTNNSAALPAQKVAAAPKVSTLGDAAELPELRAPVVRVQPTPRATGVAVAAAPAPARSAPRRSAAPRRTAPAPVVRRTVQPAPRRVVNRPAPRPQPRPQPSRPVSNPTPPPAPKPAAPKPAPKQPAAETAGTSFFDDGGGG